MWADGSKPVMATGFYQLADFIRFGYFGAVEKKTNFNITWKKV